MTLFENYGTHTAAERGAASGGYGSPAAAQNEDGARTAHVSTVAHAAAKQGAARRGHGLPGAAKNEIGASATVRNENAALSLSFGPLATTEQGLVPGDCAAVQIENDAAFLFSGARAAGQNTNTALSLSSGTRAADQNEYGAAHISVGAPAATEQGKTESGMAYLISGARTAVGVENGAAGLFTGPRAAPEQGAAHHGYRLPSVAKDKNGAAFVHFGMPIASLNENGVGHLLSGAGGEMILYKTRTAAAATETSAVYYSSGMVTGGDLLPVAQVLAGKATGGPAAAIGLRRGKDCGSLAEHVRGVLPVVGLAVAGVAATGLATGGATPATGLTMFLMLLGGLSLFTIHVLRA